MYISPEKKQEAHKNLIGTFKFWSVACPLLLLWAVPFWYKAHAAIPVYHQDCRSAPVVRLSQPSSVPCYNETATAQLKNYYHKGSIDSQDALLDFPDGHTATMGIDGSPGTKWTRSQVDGICLVETWRGQITAVLRPGARILARHNPELDGEMLSGLLIVFLAVLMLGIWTYLFVLCQQGELSNGKRIQ